MNVPLPAHFEHSIAIEMIERLGTRELIEHFARSYAEEYARKYAEAIEKNRYASLVTLGGPNGQRAW